MPKKTEPTLHFTIGRSRLLLRTIDCLHLLSMLACGLTDLPPAFRFILLLPVAASWFVQRRACEAARIFLRYTVSQGWAVSWDGEHYRGAEIAATTVAGRVLTILHFSVDSRSRALLIVKDAMAANDYRRLVVNLKISGCNRE